MFALVIDFFIIGKMPRKINDINLVFILKTEFPNKLNEFCPISLCNFMYKIISKLLANRLKQLLPIIISPTPTFFVKGMHISENSHFIQKIIHSMEHMKRKRGLILIKMDMEEAYDHIE